MKKQLFGISCILFAIAIAVACNGPSGSIYLGLLSEFIHIKKDYWILIFGLIGLFFSYKGMREGESKAHKKESQESK